MKNGCKDKFYELHRRKPGSTYYAGDETGWDLAFALSEMQPPWEKISPVEMFTSWRSGRSVLRMFSITVRPLESLASG